MKDLMKLLSQESAPTYTDADEQARDVLEKGKLLDGTPISDVKESAIKEMLEHGERARSMARQLNELASKAEEILEEDKEHLISEITTEALQMNYRHIMENAGLEDVAVAFESSDKTIELNYLSNEARKMATVAIELEDRILDLSPEGRIWSFLRADSKRLAVARGDIEQYGSKLLREGKAADISNIPIEWTLLGNLKEWIIFRNGKAVTDFTQEVINDLELVLKSFKTVQDNNTIIRKMIGDVRAGKDVDPARLNGLKRPEIIGEHILADKFVKPSTGEWGRQFGWTPANPSPVMTALLVLFTGVFAPFAIVATQKFKTNKALEEAGTKIDGNKIKRMMELFREVGKVLDRDEHADFDTSAIKKELTGDLRRVAMDVAKQSARTQGLLYEHTFLLTISTAEVMRGLKGSWELFKGSAQV